MAHALIGLLSSLFFFGVAAILMTPILRNMVLARPLTVFFAAEGLCALMSGVMLWIHESTALVMHWVRLVVMTAAAAYMLYVLCAAYRRGKDSAVPTPEPGKKNAD